MMCGARYAGRTPVGRAFAALPLRAAVLALAAAMALGWPAVTHADDAAVRLKESVESIVRRHGRGSTVSARYVETSAGRAADLLGKRRDQVDPRAPDRVYLVMLEGDFAMDDPGVRGRAPYLAFLAWKEGATLNLTDFALLQVAIPLEAAGAPQAIESFALAHPTLDRLRAQTKVFLFWASPAAALGLAAALLWWRRRHRWPYVLAACVAAGVAGWQVWLVALSLRGRPWDPAFHAFKLSLLGVVVAVDLAAAYVLLRARPSPASREGAEGVAGVGRAPSTAAPASRKRLGIGLMLLGEAAVLSLITLPWLASTGE